MFRDIEYEKWRARIIRGARWAWRYRFLLAILWVIAVFGTEILLLKIPQTNAAYTIADSARFISGNSDYLHRTFGTPTNNDIFTWSGWVKPSLTTSGTYAPLFDVNGSASTGDELTFDVSTDALEFWLGGALAADIKTSALFRDPAAWYHIVLAVDTTQAVASNRIKLYINGVQITSLATANYPSQNYTPHMNGSGGVHNLGYDPNSVNYLDGYMADVYFIDGQALSPSSFGNFDANGYWRPIAYTGTYGTNGFHLNFSNGSSLGTDSSGNSSNWTVSGLTAADQTLDSPTDSFSTFSPLQKNGATLTSGNLNGSALSVDQWTDGTFCLPASGNWYWEIYSTTVSANAEVGISDTTIENGSTFTSQVSHVYSYVASGSKRIAGTFSSYGAAWGTGDIIGIGLDNGTLTFYKDGVSQGAATTGLSGTFCPWAGQPSSSASFSFSSNFGQMAYGTSTATANTNYPAAGGYFYYQPPSGAVGLSTANLQVPSIAQPNKYFDAQTYGGNATAATMAPQIFTSSGTFTVPSSYSSLTVIVNGAGGGGGGAGGGGSCNNTNLGNASSGTGGGTSTFGSSSAVSATGGSGGGGGRAAGSGGAGGADPGGPGSGGSGSGGTTNTTGTGRDGGTGGAAGVGTCNGGEGGNGGPGGEAIMTWNSGDAGAPTPGSNITVTVGSGGAGGGGIGNGGTGSTGTNGSVIVVVNNQIFTSSGTFTVPSSYSSLTVVVNGAGGGGGGGGGGGTYNNRNSVCSSSGSSGGTGTGGGTSTFGSSSAVSATGGAGGSPGSAGNVTHFAASGAPGSAGSGSGGTTNTTGTGDPGGAAGSYGSGNNGSNCNGGEGGNGGPGGEAIMTWNSGDAGAPTPGSNITVTVGSGGAGGGGGAAASGLSTNGGAGSTGTNGSVIVGWSIPASGGSQSITRFNFQPDFVWLKDRTATNNHGIFDSLEGATKYWSSNANTAETTDAQSLLSFLSNGFSIGTTSAFDTSGDNYISWAWKKQPATDGFDIETYTGTGSAQNISHSLGAAPDMIIVKRTDSTGDPAVYDDAISTPQDNYLLLDSNAAATADSTYWNNTAPTASVFTVGTNVNVNASGGSYVAYLFKAIPGFSALGSYTGNGSTDGPFVYTGFKPRFILFKNISAANEWYIYDTARDTYNPLTTFLEPSENYADTATAFADALVNGFKVRSSNSAFNGSGDTYIYAAFADEPFYYSAQPAASGASSNAGTTFLMGMPY